ncbi:hypothetical protein DPMN_009164 [Dreissena polymorpha]|uniref:Uncharacterized protein n=1 Tax=Dreissena polymorpha TaxID=45954 RepID=A0A9D4MZI9_DREPO|nr:hypothetical protein DPMN_009164 [Dreissena polymorpha]
MGFNVSDIGHNVTDEDLDGTRAEGNVRDIERDDTTQAEENMQDEGHVNETTGSMDGEGDIERDDSNRAEKNMQFEGNINETTGNMDDEGNIERDDTRGSGDGPQFEACVYAAVLGLQPHSPAVVPAIPTSTIHWPNIYEVCRARKGRPRAQKKKQTDG